MSRLQFEHVYICRNCEEEVRGYPFGYRIADRLPLCKRCTRLGIREGIPVSETIENDALSNTVLYFVGACILVFAVILFKIFDRINL